MNPLTAPRQWPWLIRALASTITYFSAAQVGLLFATLTQHASPVWIASGIGAYLVLRWRASGCFGVLFGAFLTNFLLPTPAWASLGNAAGSCLQAWLVVRILYGKSRSRPHAEGSLRYLTRLLTGAVAPALLAAANGTLWLYLAGAVPTEKIAETGLTWLVGDSLGILMVLPLLVKSLASPAGNQETARDHRFANPSGAALLSGVILAVAALNPTHLWPLWLGFAAAPLLIRWLPDRASALFAAALSFVLLLNCLTGRSPVDLGSTNRNLLELQILIGAFLIFRCGLVELSLGSRPIRKFFPILSYFYVGALTLFYGTAAITEKTERLSIQRATESISNDVLDLLSVYEHSMHSAIGLIASSERVTAEEWEEFVRSTELTNHFPGVLGIGLAHAFDPGRPLPKGLPIHPVPQSIPETPPAPLRERYVITAIAPKSENTGALGLDIGSEAGRREAAERSRQEGTLMMSPPIQLIQANSETGSLLFHPYFGNPQGEVRPTVPAGQSGWSFKGWVYMPLKLKPFFSIALRRAERDLMARIWMGGQAEPIFSTGDWADRSPDMTTSILLAGQNARIDWARKPGLLAPLTHFGSVSVIIATLIACLALAHAATLHSANEVAEKIALRKTLELRESEAHLRDTSSKLESILEQVGLASWEYSPESKSFTLDARARKILSSGDEPCPERVGIDDFLARIAEDYRAATNAWLEHPSGGNQPTEPISVKLSDASQERWIQLRRSPGEGLIRPQLLSGTALDITELKEAERIRNREAEAGFHQSRLAALGQMAGGVAHEINNPLAIIQLRVHQILAWVADKPELKNTAQAVEQIQSTIDRISRIVRGLRTFTKGGDSDPLIRTDLRQIVRDTLPLCEERFKAAGISIALELPDTPLYSPCRSIQISQILINLLNNAYDALRAAGTAAPLVRIALEEDGDSHHILVSNNGPPIPEELKKRIFEPFFTTKGGGTGTGLGLSISQKIAYSHQGDLKVNATTTGVSFTLILPRARDAFTRHTTHGKT